MGLTNLQFLVCYKKDESVHFLTEKVVTQIPSYVKVEGSDLYHKVLTEKVDLRTLISEVEDFHCFNPCSRPYDLWRAMELIFLHRHNDENIVDAVSPYFSRFQWNPVYVTLGTLVKISEKDITKVSGCGVTIPSTLRKTILVEDSYTQQLDMKIAELQAICDKRQADMLWAQDLPLIGWLLEESYRKHYLAAASDLQDAHSYQEKVKEVRATLVSWFVHLVKEVNTVVQKSNIFLEKNGLTADNLIICFDAY